MSVDVSKIKPGDDVRLEVSNGNTLTGVVNEFAGELGIWFCGSWFPLSSWGDKWITLIASGEPEQPEWADAWVVRDAQGFFWMRRTDVCWVTTLRPSARIPQTTSELSDLGPITVVIDRDGQNVEARDVRDAADSCIQDLEDHLRCTEKSRDFAIVTGNTKLQAIRHILDGDDE